LAKSRNFSTKIEGFGAEVVAKSLTQAGGEEPLNLAIFKNLFLK